MIQIHQKLKPFSHLPGIQCLIPKSSFVVEAFPALIRVFEIETKKELLKIPLKIQGPLKQFTVMQDLERNAVSIWSEKYRFHILPSLKVIEGSSPPFSPESQERLFLGSNKKLEWEAVKKRRDFKEIFPVWFSLGASLTLPPRALNKGIFSLLDEIKKVISEKKHEDIVSHFEKLFLAGFKHMMVPRLFDDEFQGILKDETVIENPLYLLTEGSHLIRSLFFSSLKNEIFFLSHLPPEFFSGRMLHMKTPFGQWDLEWTKKMMRKVIFRPEQDGELFFYFPSPLRSFRLRHSRKEKGTFCSNGEGLEIKSDRIYLLDQFQK